MKSLSIEAFASLLPQICAADTAYEADKWSSKNPLLGHCAIVTALAHELYGGKILRASLAGTAFAEMRYHYINELPDRIKKDFTRGQFGNAYPPELVFIERERDALFEHPEMVARYSIFKKRFIEKNK